MMRDPAAAQRAVLVYPRLDDAAAYSPAPKQKSAANRAARRRPSRASIVKALSMTSDAVYFLQQDLRIVDINTAAVRGLGYRRRQLRTMRLSDFLVDSGDGQFDAGLERLADGEAPREALLARERSQRGEVRIVSIQFQWTADPDEPLIVAVVQPAPVEASPLGRPRRKAPYDFLTDLPARAELESRLRKAEGRAARKRSRFAVLFIDVDRFKEINDANGHRTGDLILQTLGRRLLSSVRPGDFVARYGGDEFVALVENIRGQAEVEQIAQRIRDALSVPIDRGGVRFQISASVGVAIGHSGSSAHDVLDEADRAMYRAKRLG